MWKYEKDSSACIITAEKHIKSCHSSSALKELPKTAVLFYMRGGESRKRLKISAHSFNRRRIPADFFQGRDVEEAGRRGC